jgi:hypothetical protein
LRSEKAPPFPTLRVTFSVVPISQTARNEISALRVFERSITELVAAEPLQDFTKRVFPRES